jgi:EmrB/QacA subfamily drug resistance transporter
VRARLFAAENRKWWTLAAVTFGLFMIMLDNTVVNVALPSIQSDLGVSQSGLEWVVNAYALTFGVLLLSGGKLADLLGRRRIFIIGLIVFTAASLACGLANSDTTLIAARTIQGVGAALMNPATLSIITATFPSRQRGMAIGIWAGISAMALAIGPLVGGILTQKINWSWIFFINVPIGVAGILAARIFIDESRDTSHEQRLDLPGLISSGIGLFAISYALISTNHHSWTSPIVLAMFAVGAVAMGVFILLEMRQRLPMLDLTLFKDATFAGANAVMLLTGVAMFGIFFFNSLFFQRIMGWSAIQTGAVFLPMTVLIMFVAPAAGKFSDRVGSRWLMAAGMLFLTGSLLDFAQLVQSSNFWDVLPALILGGIGMGLVMTPTTAAAMGSVPVDKAGVGSAVINSMRQVGGSLGIAVMGAVVATQVHTTVPGPQFAEEFTNGYHDALYVGAGITLSAAVIAVSLVRKVAHPHPATEITEAVGAA